MKLSRDRKDDLRYGTAGDEFNDALQAETRRDYAEHVRTKAANHARRNGPPPSDTHNSDAVAL